MQGVKAYEGSGSIPLHFLTCTWAVHYRLLPPCSLREQQAYPIPIRYEGGRSQPRPHTNWAFTVHNPQNNVSLRTATSGSTKSFAKCIMKDYVKYLSSAEEWQVFFCVTLKVLRAYIHAYIHTYRYIHTLFFSFFLSFFLSFLALQPPLGVVFYSPLAGFSLLAQEVS